MTGQVGQVGRVGLVGIVVAVMAIVPLRMEAQQVTAQCAEEAGSEAAGLGHFTASF